MISDITKFVAVLFSSISIHALNMSLASKTAIHISNNATAEYHRHSCGRAIAAIQNFKVIANNLKKSGQIPSQAISDTLAFIQNALTETYGKFYKVEESFCIDRRTLRPAVTVYRRGPDNNINSPNFSYRFL